MEIVVTSPKTTQKQDILKFLHENGSITPLDALKEFGCMRLAARICELVKEGYPISTEMEISYNRYGAPVRHARYKLVA